MSFNDLQNREFAKATDLRIAGARGLGVYRLFVTFGLHLVAMRPGEPATITEWDGDVTATGKGGRDEYVGKLRPANAHTVWLEQTEYPRDDQLSFEVELDRSRIEALERVRLGEGLSFTFGLRCRVEWQQMQPLKRTVRVLVDNLTYRANQSTWIEVLEGMDYTKVLLMELPVPDRETQPERAEVSVHVMQAQEAIAHGHYREAVGHCRDCLEALMMTLGDKDDLSNQALSNLFNDTRAMDKVQRLRVVRRALALLCHPARHVDEATVLIDWRREDAVAAVSMVTALLCVT